MLKPFPLHLEVLNDSPLLSLSLFLLPTTYQALSTPILCFVRRRRCCHYAQTHSTHLPPPSQQTHGSFHQLHPRRQ
jgi:hypothetical protein